MANPNHFQHTSKAACHDTYIGHKPWSEPEAVAIRDFILYTSNAEFKVTIHFCMYTYHRCYIIVFAFFVTWIIFFDTFQMYISLHSFGELILYPWSHTKKPIHDWHELDEMARRWSDVVFRSSKGKYKYRVGNGYLNNKTCLNKT